MFERHFFRHERCSRFFEKGDLKYIILDLLKDKPSHGYEIIRALEERFHGFYSPSAGSIYPTLQLLEDMGYAKSAEQDGKKVYTITEEGKKFLFEHDEIVEKIKKNMRDWGCNCDKGEIQDLMDEFRDISHVFKHEASKLNSENFGKIKDVLKKAGKDIESILNE
jgi:DNA-binding PadR family transcriptional regulator